MTVQKNTTKLVGGVGKSIFFVHLFILFLAAPLALERMIKVAGTESYTIAQTLKPLLLFQRLFPADWSTILL